MLLGELARRRRMKRARRKEGSEAEKRKRKRRKRGGRNPQALLFGRLAWRHTTRPDSRMDGCVVWWQTQRGRSPPHSISFFLSFFSSLFLSENTRSHPWGSFLINSHNVFTYLLIYFFIVFIGFFLPGWINISSSIFSLSRILLCERPSAHIYPPLYDFSLFLCTHVLYIDLRQLIPDGRRKYNCGSY